jgi:c-di-GMP-binding flagellar brake protein YcgR
MDIAIGTTVLLEFFATRERVKCQFVGLSGTDFLVLRVPLTTGSRERFREGNTLTFRYLNQGSLVGFRSEVLHYMASPFSLLFVSYPMEIETRQLRDSRRVPCNFPAVLDAGSRTIKGVISDISDGGCLFVHDPAGDEEFELRPGEQVAGSFHVLEKTKKYPFKARVTSMQACGDKRLAGLSFDPAQTRLPDSVRDYIEEIAEFLEGEAKPGRRR